MKDNKVSRRFISGVILGLLLLVSAAIGYAQVGGSFDLSWSTVDGGGGRSVTSGYDLTGDIGQSDSTILTYSTVYTLYGGFYWAGPIATPCPSCPTATPLPTPTACTLSFRDVPPGSAFYPYVICMACRGMIGGYSDGTFRPNVAVTRGQLAKIVSNAAGYTDDPGPQTYEDLPPDSVFYDYVQRLSNRSVMNGYPCGGPGEPCDSQLRPYFRWGSNATRGQIAKIVANAAGLTEQPTGQTFADVPPALNFYVYIERLAALGVMNGYPCGGSGEPCDSQHRPYFRSARAATRGQTAKIVANTFFPDCQP